MDVIERLKSRCQSTFIVELVRACTCQSARATNPIGTERKNTLLLSSQQLLFVPPFSLGGDEYAFANTTIILTTGTNKILLIPDFGYPVCTRYVYIASWITCMQLSVSRFTIIEGCAVLCVQGFAVGNTSRVKPGEKHMYTYMQRRVAGV